MDAPQSHWRGDLDRGPAFGEGRSGDRRDPVPRNVPSQHRCDGDQELHPGHGPAALHHLRPGLETDLHALHRVAEPGERDRRRGHQTGRHEGDRRDLHDPAGRHLGRRHARSRPRTCCSPRKSASTRRAASPTAELFARTSSGSTAVDDKTFTIHWDKFTLRLQRDQRLPAAAGASGAARCSTPTRPQYRTRTLYDTDPTNPGLYFGPYRITRGRIRRLCRARTEPDLVGREAAASSGSWSRRSRTPRRSKPTCSPARSTSSPARSGCRSSRRIAFEKRHGKRFNVVYKPGLFFEHVDLNLDNPILADERVRQALLMALDREAISRTAVRRQAAGRATRTSTRWTGSTPTTSPIPVRSRRRRRAAGRGRAGSSSRRRHAPRRRRRRRSASSS